MVAVSPWTLPQQPSTSKAADKINVLSIEIVKEADGGQGLSTDKDKDDKDKNEDNAGLQTDNAKDKDKNDAEDKPVQKDDAGKGLKTPPNRNSPKSSSLKRIKRIFCPVGLNSWNNK